MNKPVITRERMLDHENGYFAAIRPEGGDLAFTMSGRCGLYLCMEDIKLRDTKRVVYLPRYTCETVAAPFDKAGYKVLFYDVDEQLNSIFDYSVIDEISVLSLCGYYGFCNYDREFVKACHERGVFIIEDLTHSAFSEGGVDPMCDYAAGSFRKWMDVPCGGFAIKREGKFQIGLQEHDQVHVGHRRKYVETHKMDDFWPGEMMLRRMFDLYKSDEESEYLMRHVDLENLKACRRANYQTLLDNLPEKMNGLRVIFPQLRDGVIPSHFSMYAENRDHFLQYLAANNIFYKVFWPVGPLVEADGLDGHDAVRYVYDHIFSLICDQHCSREDMLRLAEILAAYPGA